ACTINPAAVIKRDNTIGSLKVGKIADIIAVDRVYNLKSVIVKGNLIRR
ncbi:MAG: amidohydrolase family protein, partial [Clostridiales bacterium]|nr:amidohydrolase family protein [Clostridiales bacterium]